MSKSLRTVESVLESLGERQAIGIDIDPRVKWALLDDGAYDSLVGWLDAQGEGRVQHITARFAGAGRMLLVQAELRGNVAAICVVSTHLLGEARSEEYRQAC
jgi:hypothetical protein